MTSPEPTLSELQDKLRSYEEGMQDIADGLHHGIMPPDDAEFNLRALLEATGADHVRAIRHREEQIAAVMAFKTRVLREVIQTNRTTCPLCLIQLPAHQTNCLVQTALSLCIDDLTAGKSERQHLDALRIHIDSLQRD